MKIFEYASAFFPLRNRLTTQSVWDIIFAFAIVIVHLEETFNNWLFSICESQIVQEVCKVMNLN